MGLIPAYKRHDALWEEIESSKYERGVKLWWLGQSGYLLQYQGKRILIDPYLSDSLTKKYHGTDKPHVRMSELVIHPHFLNDIDIVTSSHNHTDHLDAETLVPILENNPTIKFVIPEANRSFVCDRLNCPLNFPIGMNDGQQLKLDKFYFYGIPASHNTIDRDDFGNCKYMGYVIKFENYTIYHSGDTLWFDGLESILKPFNVDIVFLPINGNLPERKVAGNLDSKEAAMLGKAIDARIVIPCHYDQFTFNTADVNDFEKFAQHINQKYIVLKGGQSFHYIKS
jgi:L-ascorbate metabolism protein UlaG (beta-lactamase superfamily)